MVAKDRGEAGEYYERLLIAVVVTPTGMS